MKKFLNNIYAMAVMLTASASFVACSNDIDKPQQPANGKYTMTIKASKGGEGTRALSLVGKTLNATWATTENVYVQKGETWATGSLQPQENGTITTLKGELSNVTINADDVLTLQFPRSGALNYTGQVGTLADIAARYDYATASVTVASISSSGNINPVAATTEFDNQQAIIKFTLLDKVNSAAISPSELTITDGTSTVSLTDIPAATYTANEATNVLYVAFPAAGIAKNITLTATVGDAHYIYEKSDVTFTNGQYYEITVKMSNVMLAVPLTLEATTAGTIVVSSPKSGMQYSKNGGDKTAVTTDPIDVIVGDKVAFYGNGTSITSYKGTRISGGTADVKVYGNIMSLVDEENFANATTLRINIFFGLFRDNTTLTDASCLQLPATTLNDYCYSNMFWGCTSLTSAPELPATTLSLECYSHMFRECTSLTSMPELSASNLANSCYKNMFSYCYNLTTIPGLPATTLANGCYEQMFCYCTSLTTAPELPATTLYRYCYYEMFYNCTNLVTAPYLSATILAEGCYDGMFKNCTSMTTAPETLPALELTAYCYTSMFSGCTNLKAAPQLPATSLNTLCYDRMFSNCSKLTTAPELRATTLCWGCYRNMFQDCTSLTKAPDLLATTLIESCYEEMFWGCSSLNNIKCLAINISATDCAKNWLYGVAETGTFTKARGMNDWIIDDYDGGIPEHWTIVEE